MTDPETSAGSGAHERGGLASGGAGGGVPGVMGGWYHGADPGATPWYTSGSPKTGKS